ncbi:hypothetical protein ACFE04_012077 [Oxalis oulophora]
MGAIETAGRASVDCGWEEDAQLFMAGLRRTAAGQRTAGQLIVAGNWSLNHFLQSESDEIPNSLKQIATIAASNEFSHSFVKKFSNQMKERVSNLVEFPGMPCSSESQEYEAPA